MARLQLLSLLLLLQYTRVQDLALSGQVATLELSLARQLHPKPGRAKRGAPRWSCEGGAVTVRTWHYACLSNHSEPSDSPFNRSDADLIYSVKMY